MHLHGFCRKTAGTGSFWILTGSQDIQVVLPLLLAGPASPSFLTAVVVENMDGIQQKDLQLQGPADRRMIREVYCNPVYRVQTGYLCCGSVLEIRNSF